MKNLFFLLLLCLIFSCKNNELKLIDEEVLIQKVLNGDNPKDEAQIFRDINGNEITQDSIQNIKDIHQYFTDVYVDQKGKVKEIRLRKRTPKDEIFIEKVNARLNQTQPLKTIEIECSQIGSILQSVYEKDQGTRQEGNQIDRNIDHENLETVVSIIEQCGMPTLKKVSSQQMSAVWLVLQHAPQEYQSKYIPLLEKSAENGDIEFSVIALMKDRELMYKDEPQIYGSQVRGDKLYELLEPEYVDQRRAEVGMEPLEDYLEYFDVEFNVPQKTK